MRQFNDVDMQGRHIYHCPELDQIGMFSYFPLQDADGDGLTDSDGDIILLRVYREGLGINDLDTSRSTTWSSAKIKEEIDELGNKPMIYGVMWTGGKKTKLTRINDAAGLDDPIPYFDGITEECSSPFDTIMPWAGMERVSDPEAGELVKIPKFYYRFTQDGKVLKLQISNSKVPGFYTSPAHADRGDGNGERDFVYIGRYHCAENTYKSTTGVNPQMRITRSDARTAIHNLGTTIWQADIAMRLTIQMLYLVEYADWDSQATIGGGCSETTASSSAVFNMGSTDSMPYHTGTVSGSHSAYGACQYRWIEGLWGNCYDWADGCYYNSSGMSIILNPNNFSDSDNGNLIGKPINGWITAWDVKEYGGVQWLIPSSTSGGASGVYVSDSWDYGPSYQTAFSGGSYSQTRKAGMFYMGCGNTTGQYPNVGCRLQKLP